MSGSDKYHVIVLWEAWEGVASDDREEIILEAYSKFDQTPGSTDKISTRIKLAIGATPDDVIDLDLLPYSIAATHILGRSFPEAECRRLMLEEGGFPWSTGIYLGFPTREMAEDAIDRLTKALPEGNWHLNSPRN